LLKNRAKLFCPVLYRSSEFHYLQSCEYLLKRKVGKLVLENPIPAGTG